MKEDQETKSKSESPKNVSSSETPTTTPKLQQKSSSVISCRPKPRPLFVHCQGLLEPPSPGPLPPNTPVSSTAVQTTSPLASVIMQPQPSKGHSRTSSSPLLHQHLASSIHRDHSSTSPRNSLIFTSTTSSSGQSGASSPLPASAGTRPPRLSLSPLPPPPQPQDQPQSGSASAPIARSCSDSTLRRAALHLNLGAAQQQAQMAAMTPNASGNVTAPPMPGTPVAGTPGGGFPMSASGLPSFTSLQQFKVWV